jgi:hypothetical protein
MVAKKTTGRRGGKGLRVKKETLRDLGAKSRGKNVKAGKGRGTGDFCTVGCNFSIFACQPTR